MSESVRHFGGMRVIEDGRVPPGIPILTTPEGSVYVQDKHVVMHSVLVRDELPYLWEAERRLREHGYHPDRGHAVHGKRHLIFMGAAGANLDFLIPDFLPPA
jgi:hypothetical protein